MNMISNFENLRLHSLLTPKKNLTIFDRSVLQIRERRLWKKRRRLKFHRSLTLRCNQSGPSPFESFFHDLASQFPSVNTLDIIVPALGFASGVALYFSRWKLRPISQVSEDVHVGEWILFTSPTPFNRFVMLRCPSISFEGVELTEDVNDRLVKEDKHFVSLNGGGIHLRDEGGEELVYQRTCVATDDGGVISLDWPANLELSEEHGLDTTLLFIPGTANGSMDVNVRSFVRGSLKYGCFPIVMNPRGCAGSPLTTPRLFTAADSDDVSTAIQFVNKARPWTTLMGVGWGFGANMLTKYLAEVGEKTPLTAATCIDNPFDLEEATRSSPYDITIDKKFTGGLVDILKSNKELFQGQAKGFKVKKALSASSVREFETAISIVSYGFDAIEDFYAESSTRGVIGNLKIPVLFIQNDYGTAPIFSIPRSSIAENPFTSLLLCSYFPSNVASGRPTMSCCQHLVLEWLAAVELGLLKGRHPLLEDVDVAINPSKGLALVEDNASNRNGKVKKLLSVHHSDALNEHSLDPSKTVLKGAATVNTGQDSWRRFDLKGSQENNVRLKYTDSVDVELIEVEGGSSADSERGQVLQSAEIVMNMLDLTMPSTLGEEQRKKVLNAVGEGETVMKALQDAVPGDVRGKLTKAVSEILHNQSHNLKLYGIFNASKIPDVASGLKSKIKEKIGLSSAEGSNGDPYAPEEKSRVYDQTNNSIKNQTSMDKQPENEGSETHASENLRSSTDVGQFRASNSHESDASCSGEKVADESVNGYEKAGFLGEKDSQLGESGHKTGIKPNVSGHSESAGGIDGVICDQYKEDLDNGIAQSDMKEENANKKREERSSGSTDQNKIILSTMTEEGLPLQESGSEANLSDKENNTDQRREENSMQSVPNQNSSNSPSFSVTQALDALTEFDDSTQMAVNSVFNVIEDMISRLEVGKYDEIEGKDKDGGKKSESLSKYHHIVDEMKLEEKDGNSSDIRFDHLSSHNSLTLENDLRVIKKAEIPFQKAQRNDMGSHSVEGNKKSQHLISRNFSAEHSTNKLSAKNSLHHIPLYIITNQPHADPLYKEYLRNYLISKVKNTRPLDLDKTTALFLDYIPEEGQQKLLEQADLGKDSGSNDGTHEHGRRNDQLDLYIKAEYTGKIIEPSYVILDDGKQEEAYDENQITWQTNETVDIGNATSTELMVSVKNIVLDSLKVEVGRRLSAADVKEMEPTIARDLKQIADAVSVAVGRGKEHIMISEGKEYTSDEPRTLDGECIIEAISSAVQGTRYLRGLLPVGVIIGSSLAALRKKFNVATLSGDGQDEDVTMLEPISNYGERNCAQADEMEAGQLYTDENGLKHGVEILTDKYVNETESLSPNHDPVMVGAVTAAIGASAFLVHQQDLLEGKEMTGTESNSFNEKESHREETAELKEEISEKNQNSIVTSLTEKAMSVAGPVVPTKEDGEVDQERLVAMLAELGQKGGILRLIGKMALLWGGIRGALSLTGKLISFLRFAERPLFQRILGFVCMVIVLWSPVVVPLLPTLVQSWSSHKSSKIAELACVLGLYTSIMILVALWGKRIRGYENSLQQYGLNLSSSLEIQNFLKGFIGGVLLVLLIHSINAVLGCIHLSWPLSFLYTSVNALTLLKVSGKIIMLIAQGFITATGVALVEELLFRSWLPDEIAVDLGYHRGIIISGLAFSLFQRLPSAIPGLWLLSLALAGIRQRCQGSLSLPIGLRAGILSSSFILQRGGFLTYHSNYLMWAAGSHSLQSFSGLVGVAFSLLFAVIFYPWQWPNRKKVKRIISE